MTISETAWGAAANSMSDVQNYQAPSDATPVAELASDLSDPSDPIDPTAAAIRDAGNAPNAPANAEEDPSASTVAAPGPHATPGPDAPEPMTEVD